MHWRLHEGFPNLDRESLIKYAREIGLDVKRFTKDIDTMAHMDIINRDLALAKKLDLYNTPTFFINNRKIVGNVPYAYLKKKVEEALRKTQPQGLQIEPVEPFTLATERARKMAELGRMLFFDRRLSGDGTMSCATCHNPELGYTDGLAISLSYPTTRNWRNAPTIINVAYLDSYFWDGRAESLEQQALFPIMSAFEMNQNLDYLEEELKEVPYYRKAFREIFGGPINRMFIAQALAAFQRTIVSTNSPLDRYLKGDTSALSSLEKLGYEVFKGKGRCILCHYGPNLTDNKFHNLGVPENPEIIDDPRVAATRRFTAKVSGYKDYDNLKTDPGRYLVTKSDKDWKAFRTPTLREIARTAPYMHNGVFKTLEEVVEFFDRGGGSDPRKSPLLKVLHLSKKEKKALVEFLRHGLSGQYPIVKPPALPE